MILKQLLKEMVFDRHYLPDLIKIIVDYLGYVFPAIVIISEDHYSSPSFTYRLTDIDQLLDAVFDEHRRWFIKLNQWLCRDTYSSIILNTTSPNKTDKIKARERLRDYYSKILIKEADTKRWFYINHYFNWDKLYLQFIPMDSNTNCQQEPIRHFLGGWQPYVE